MKKKILSALLCVIVLMAIAPTAALADSGPKPSVVVEFEGLGQENCYVTLLSKTESTGPYSAYGVYSDPARYTQSDEDFEIWQKFVSYEDADGFYFLQYFSKLGDDSTYKWTYYPPAAFKILMYFPDSDSFAVSDEIYERYAFDSYFTVDAANLNVNAGGTVGAVKSYDYTWEIISLLARIIITIALELAVALLFGFRAKKQILLIVITNVVTQTVLNVLLNITNYNQGQMMFVINFFLLELLVFAIEAVVYSFALNRYAARPVRKWLPAVYALCANLLSFAAGLGIAYLIPGIF